MSPGHGVRVGRLLRSVRVAALAAAGVATVAAVDHRTLTPLLFTSLGPTAYQLAYRPSEEASRVSNAVPAHLIAAGCGLLSLWVFGLWGAPSIVIAGHATVPRIGAAGFALAVTLLLLELSNRHHAPAGSTTLVVALGIAAPWRQFFGLLAGLAIVIGLTSALTLATRRVARDVADRGGASKAIGGA